MTSTYSTAAAKAIVDASFAAMLNVPHDDCSRVAWLDNTIDALEGQVVLMRELRASIVNFYSSLVNF